MTDMITYLRDGRHVFSICPECGEIHRLTDLQLSSKGRYTRDWLDDLQEELARLGQRRDDLEGRQRELKAAAKEKAERRILPQVLRKAVPTIHRWGIDPRDIRPLISPLEFVAFRGMNSQDGIREVTFLNLSGPSSLSKSISETAVARRVAWATVRVKDDGELEVEGSRGRSASKEGTTR